MKDERGGAEAPEGAFCLMLKTENERDLDGNLLATQLCLLWDDMCWRRGASGEWILAVQICSSGSGC